MKTLYLDLFSGISGDMFIGALVDLGVDPHQFEKELDKLGLKEFHLHFAPGTKQSIAGVKFDVHLEHEHNHDHHRGSEAHGPTHDHSHAHSHEHHHHHSHEDEHTHVHKHGHTHVHEHEHEHGHERTFSEIRSLIESSSLSAWVKEKSVAIFHRIAVAEGRIHGLPPEQVHFHEVGAIDSIVDIVGACIGLEMLGRPRLVASSIVDGTGTIHCAHGLLPIPAPATLAILSKRGIPITQCSEPHELITPTGAALLAEFVEEFGSMHGLVPEKIGYGLGSRDNRTRPNVLRVVLGQTQAANAAHDWQTDTIAVIETNLDDINSEVLGDFITRAMAAGALDVFHTAIQMKKSRPGVLLTVLCNESEADKFSELILRETSAFGVRRYLAERRKLSREFSKVSTAFGEVKVKLGRLDGKVVQTAPEFEDCKRLAEKAKVPLKEVYEAAMQGLRLKSQG